MQLQCLVCIYVHCIGILHVKLYSTHRIADDSQVINLYRPKIAFKKDLFFFLWVKVVNPVQEHQPRCSTFFRFLIYGGYFLGLEPYKTKCFTEHHQHIQLVSGHAGYTDLNAVCLCGLMLNIFKLHIK